MLRALRDPEPPAASEVEQFLVESAEFSVELCLELLLNRSVPGGEDQPPQRLSIQQENIVLAALGRMPNSLVRTSADERLRDDKSEHARVVGCRVYGRTGNASDVDLLFELARENESEVVSPEIRAALRDGLSQLLTAPDTARAVQRKWHEIPSALREPALLALGDARNPRMLPLLEEIIVWDDEWVLLALAQVRLIGASLDAQLNFAVATAIAERLDDDDPRIQEVACLALGELESEVHVADLIELLEHSNSIVRNAAHRSLALITAEELPPNARVWRVWHDRERGAVQTLLSKLTEKNLAAPDPRALALLAECTRHRLGRHDIAFALVPGLEHQSATVRVQACRVMQELDSPLAARALCHALGDPESDVRDAAREALGAITGATSIETSDQWRDYLDAYSDLN